MRYFQNLLSTTSSSSMDGASRFFTGRIPENMRDPLIAAVTDEEIRHALFSIPDDKAPGPDGYTSLFFKRAWGIIGGDFTAAIRYFFSSGHLPKCVNATRITLIPKVENPRSLSDFRPISCCNVLYKCITKIVASRFREILPSVIGNAQSAFIPGRQISDSIFLTQELIRNYHLQTSSHRCALKVDIRKAFDTVSWDFILLALRTIGIPDTMIRWIQTCITTAHFSVALNGELHGFFRSGRGIRQGDPLSPYLFVLTMEGLAGIMRATALDPGFTYHWRCRQTSITHLCFADDLMVFCHADTSSVRLVRSALDDFTRVSGLAINTQKSNVYLSGVSEEIRPHLQAIMGYRFGTLPARYLGVPLVTTRLRHSDCLPLIERILSRIRLWTSATLSYAGRLQLIRSVLFSIQVYWSSMFILPSATIRRIESILAAFLWKGTTLSSAGAKVAWSSICFPRREGGLGVKRLQTWNRSAILRHIWRLLTDHESTWSSWVRATLLRGQSFWSVRVTSGASWTWRKILQSRH